MSRMSLLNRSGNSGLDCDVLSSPAALWETCWSSPRRIPMIVLVCSCLLRGIVFLYSGWYNRINWLYTGWMV